MGVPDQPGKARRAACTARSTSWWPDIGTREMTDPSLGLWTSIVGSVATSSFGAPAMTLGTGAEFSWVPASVLEELGIERRKRIRFQQADGSLLERAVGFAIVHAGGTMTTDEVVFGEPN